MAAQRLLVDNREVVKPQRVSFTNQTDQRREPQSRFPRLHRLTTYGFDSNTRRPSEAAYHEDIEQSPFSVLNFASPKSDGLGQYYPENKTRRILQDGRPPQMLSTPATQTFPKRHSTTLTPGVLSTHFEGIAVSSPAAPIPSPRTQVHRKSIIDDSRAMLLSGVGISELETLGGCISSGKQAHNSKHQPRNPSITRRDHSQDVLREWGQTYLGNTVTADVLVRPLHLRGRDRAPARNPPEAPTPVGKSRHEGEHVVVRARVTPLAKERQPFLIQRRFNLRELRAASSVPGSRKEQADPGDGESPLKSETRSADTRGRVGSSLSAGGLQALDGGLWGSWKPSGNAVVSRSRRVMPIHVKYAVRYLPVLGALLLSGHVRRGDIIDLPLPHPEAWRDVVCYIYTGRGEMTHSMQENILYLAGRVD